MTDGGLSSLAYNRVLSTEGTGCPGKREFVLLSLSTGAVIPVPCQRNACPVCGPKKAYATAVAVDMAAPRRFVRLSLVGEEHQERRRRINRMVEYLRRDGYQWEHWGVVEQNPKGTGHHAHLWQGGDYVPQGVLQEACMSAGMGYPDIRAWKPIKGRFGAAYGVKAISKAGTLYGVKGTREGGLEAFLRANGGRYGMWTRGFFGMPYRQALKDGMRAVYGQEDEGPWVLRAAAAV